MKMFKNKMKLTTTKIIQLVALVVLYILFLYWVESWWGLIVLPLLVDYLITQYLPWFWWKESINPIIKLVMGWIDAIVFAGIAVYFVNLFFFQNCYIPSSSLEKSLLTGDYLLVSKIHYGPRIPQTPLTLPLTQHTLPIFNTKSYIEWPRWKYRRVKGLGKIERGDIVVFNYPSGDTVALNAQNMDYYSLCYQLGKNFVQVEDTTKGYEAEQRSFEQMYSLGKTYIQQNVQEFGDVISRPVDRRENYVKRCVGLPGDTLQIKKGTIFINHIAQKQPPKVEFTYLVHFINNPAPQVLKELGISQEDISVQVYADDPSWRAVPLTEESKKALLKHTDLVDEIKPLPESFSSTRLYPLNKKTDWTPENYGPIYIPQKGATIPLTLENLPFFERPIRVYEQNKLEVKDQKIYINDRLANTYTFKMDYYFMMGDNRDNSADSRFWGFVPEDHIVGKPLFVWLSLDPDYGWFDGKIRWNRFFLWVDDTK